MWLLLTWTLGYQELVAGLAVSFLASAVFGGYLPFEPSKLINPVRWFWFVVYIPVFLYQCLKSNIDVALRVLSPGLQLRPAIVRVRTKVASEVGRVFLANSITLTPGTMTVELHDDMLYVHWIEMGDEDPVKAAKAIFGRFEFFLQRIFD